MTAPIEPALDHLIYAVPDLAAAVAEFAAITGVEPVPGGRHLGHGTRNHLVGLGGRAYLEIVGPDVEHPAAPGVQVPFGVDRLLAPKLVTWAVHPADIEAAARASAAAGAPLGEIWPMSRRTPDGGLLEWRLAAPDPAPFDGITPFLIDWGATPHPATAPGLPALRLVGLAATHPDPAGVGAVLRALEVHLPVERGAPALEARFATPRGPVVLT